MPKTDIKLYSTEPSGKATTATISDVNPEATNDELKTLGQMLNSFTRNRYDKTNRINTIQCDTEPGGGSQTATITLAKTTDTKANLLAAAQSLDNKMLCYLIDYSYDGDGAISVSSTNQNLSATFYTSQIAVCSPVTISQLQTEITNDVTFTFTAAATDTYKAASATFTITV